MLYMIIIIIIINNYIYETGTVHVLKEAVVSISPVRQTTAG